MIAATTSQKHRDERIVLAVADTGDSAVAGLDIFFAPFGDQTGWTHRECEQEQREDDDVY